MKGLDEKGKKEKKKRKKKIHGSVMVSSVSFGKELMVIYVLISRIGG